MRSIVCETDAGLQVTAGSASGPGRPLVVVTPHRFPDLQLECAVLAPLGAEVRAASSMEEVVELAPQADALLVSSIVKVDALLIERLSRCRAIARYGVGADNVDLVAATRAGIPVGNVPDASVEEVADHALLLALAVLRDLQGAATALRDGRWGTGSLRPVPRLSTLTAGIVGFGRIGRAVAARFAALGCSVVVSDPFASELPFPLLELDELLAASDVVSLHVPLEEGTRHLLSAERLALLRSGAVLVNVSRGGLVDEVALARALERGELAGAALDVFEHEPLPHDHPLRSAPRAVLTPHVAFYSDHAVRDLQRLAATQVARALRGERLDPVLNPSVYDPTG